MRLDIWQHGTNRALNEVAFIVQQESDKPVPPEQNYIQIEPLGRTNVAYRWAGEADLFESLASVQQRYRIDPKRIVLRGFSMGGASTWHLGLHHPGRWAAIESGAGFTETRNYGHRETLPPYQEAMLHYYDAADYSLNAFNAPTVGYGGEDDAQLRASVNIREQLAKEGMRFTQDGPFRWVSNDLRAIFLVGPKTGHSWHPDSRAESNAFINKALETADEVPDRVRFVTYTARFNRAHWLTVDALDRTHERADVDARRSPDGKHAHRHDEEREPADGRVRHHIHDRRSGARRAALSGPPGDVRKPTAPGRSRKASRLACARSTDCRGRWTMRSWTRLCACVRPERRGMRLPTTGPARPCPCSRRTSRSGCAATCA